MRDLVRDLRLELAGMDHQRLAVALSGGLDSTVLLHAAVSVGGAGASAALPVPLLAVHVNHGLHPSADQWQAHCAAACRKLGIELLCQRVSVGPGNLEARARRARYQAFDALLGPGDLLLLAHHQDDQAETVLMRLAQGRGTAAMPRTRQLPGGAVLLRPFLGMPKRRLRAAAEQLGLDWLEDPSNADAAFDRNFLRHQVLPGLAERWPGVTAAVARAGKAQADTEALLRHLLNRDALLLGDVPAHLRPKALRAWLARFDEQGVSERALVEFAAQFDAPTDAQPELRLRPHSLDAASLRPHMLRAASLGAISSPADTAAPDAASSPSGASPAGASPAGALGAATPGTASLRRWRGAVYYAPPPPALAASYQVQPPDALRLPHGELVIEKWSVDELAVEQGAARHGSGGFSPRGGVFVAGRFCAESGVCAAGALTVRFRRGGERVRSARGSRSLKRLMQDAGLPPWLRPSYPLLYSGDALVAVPGIAEAHWEGEAAGGPKAPPRWRVKWTPAS